MGDRANVAILDYSRTNPDDSFGAVVLYTHWGGTELPARVQEALRKRERWDDAAYLARIVFCRMLAGSGDQTPLATTTGYGISTTLCDNEYPVLVLDSVTQRIGSRPEGDWRRPVREPEGLTFEEFCRLTNLDAARTFRERFGLGLSPAEKEKGRI